MARTSLIVKQQRLAKKFREAKKAGKKMKKICKYYNRCQLCGRPGAYVRDFGTCRVCLRKYARA